MYKNRVFFRKVKMRAPWLLILISVFHISCNQTQIQRFTSNLKEALEIFRDQSIETNEAIKEAEKARMIAMKAEILKYSSSETKKFIGKMKEAEEATISLRERFNNVIKSADFFFAYCEKKAKTINDSNQKSKISNLIRGRKRTFTAKIIQTHNTILAVEAAIKKGKDVVTSLEILGALKAVDGKLIDLESIFNEASRMLPKTQALINEGMNLFDSEFNQL